MPKTRDSAMNHQEDTLRQAALVNADAARLLSLTTDPTTKWGNEEVRLLRIKLMTHDGHSYSICLISALYDIIDGTY